MGCGVLWINLANKHEALMHASSTSQGIRVNLRAPRLIF